MAFKVKSISVKIGLLYIFLAIINMSIFTILIYENQIDLITENTKYHVQEFTTNLITTLNNLSDEFKAQNKSQNEVINQIANEINKFNSIDSTIAKTVKKTTRFFSQIITRLSGKKKPSVNTSENKIEGFLIFDENGKTIFASQQNFSLSESDLANGIKAVTSVEFSGKQYYSKIDENAGVISFYVPLKIYTLNGTVLFLKMKMTDFNERINELYKIIAIVIAIIAVFHIFFALFLFGLFVKPIQNLHSRSLEISNGNLSVRSNIKQKDEIGELGKAFNTMADSIQEKIEVLSKYNEMMEIEMNIAGDVQKMIFPIIEDNKFFIFNIFFKAFGKVSGDYYDIFDLGKNRWGFLLVDASGHGVPAALITMVAKEQFRLYAPNVIDPAELFRKVNKKISDILEEHETQGFYFSAFYFILDENKRITFCNAGHTQPILVRSKNKKITILTTAGFLVGISSDMNDLYETKSTTVESGDKIVLYTDGISEPVNANGEQFGRERLIESMKKSFVLNGKKILDTVISDLSSFTDMEKLKDDATLIIIEIK